MPHADAAAPYDHFRLGEIQQPPTLDRSPSARYKQLTALEVGMYVLLSMFGVAIVVFAGSFCVVYTWKVKDGTVRIPSPGYKGNNEQSNQDSVTNAHDWVWLGRATLERASGMGVSPESQTNCGGLVPLSDLNGNSQQQQLWRESQRKSSNTFEQSQFTPVNITSNPGAESEPLLDNVEKDDQTDHTNEAKFIDSSTYIRLNARGQRRVTFNNLSEDLANGGNSSEEDRPPIPPHRNIGVTANVSQKHLSRSAAARYFQQNKFQKEGTPPPIPPHGVNVIKNPFEPHYSQHMNNAEQNFEAHSQINPSNHLVQQKNPENAVDPKVSKLGDPKFVEVNADDFVRLRGVTRGRAAQVRRATILENPLLSAALPDNLNITDHLDNLPPSMDYDQLMEYFSNLKESNA